MAGPDSTAPLDVPGAVAGALDGSGLRVAVLQSVFNAEITNGLLAGALACLDDCGARDVTVIRVPGAFELPLAAKAAATGGHDAVVALGAVILGDTDHYEHVAHRASEGLQAVMLETGVPVAFGVLTVRSIEDARARSMAGPGNKGAEAAASAVRTAQLLRSLR